MSDGKAVDLFNRLRLTNSWLREHGTPIVTCGECGRKLTKEEWEKHKKGDQHFYGEVLKGEK